MLAAGAASRSLKPRLKEFGPLLVKVRQSRSLMPNTISETHELASPAAAPSTKRRLASQHVREARDRLTSTSGTRPVFDYELLRQFAQNRISASPVILVLIVTIGALSGLWTGAIVCACGPPARSSSISSSSAPAASSSKSRRRPRNCAVGACALSCSICFSAWPGLHPDQSDRHDDQAATFMLFVMLLVVAISSMLASSLPIAVFALTLPVTVAIALDFAVKHTLHDYILAIMALTAEGYFSLLAYRLYSTTLATLEARAKKTP